MTSFERIVSKSVQFLSFRPLLKLPGRHLNAGQTHGPDERKLTSILEKTFPQAASIEVNDISGGCGAMFEISVQAPELKGLSIVKQHRLVTEALKEEIKDMHGLRIHTSVPP